jgi:nitrate reductase / nitrite oxidoreductase, alpha subunit
MSWIKDIMDPKKRVWEEMYRNRWQHDKRVRSTHGVNCTGGCSWEVYVKDGIVTWETQATDYPRLEPGLPPYEPRGCQRGITFSWYVYSPLRVKYPYVRGVLIDLWRTARKAHADPVAAWASIVENEASRKSYQQARGKGGLRRSAWDEVLEIIAASTIYTAKKYGPDRIIGFSPIPAMSMLSYAAGTRFLQLFGGVALSFYDWYADFPPASPEVWGEKTDVAESADWYNSKFIVTMGANLNMTRTPDVHFVAEARNNGAKLVVCSPDFSQVAKYADWWLPINAGQDGAFWMAVNHVILKEFHVEREVPYFTAYLKRFADAPFLVELEEREGAYRAGRFLRADRIDRYHKEEHGEWKFLVFDKNSGEPRMPRGSIGFRWQEHKGQWNLEMKDGKDGSQIDPLLSLLDRRDGELPIVFTEFASKRNFSRHVPIRYVQTDKGKIAVTTVYDILMAQHGVSRKLEGDYPKGYDDQDAPYTPAWQEQYTGISRDTVVRFAREWAQTAEKTKGKCMIIVGSGINHWYHANITYRTAITSLILCGCVGKNGGGLNHYTGQEKLAPEASWKSLAFALDWTHGPRLVNAPSFHYVHCDQWRYDDPQHEGGILGFRHPMDMQVNAVRRGWLPFFPQFNRNPIELVREAEQAGARSETEIITWLVKQLKERKVCFAVEDPDAPENWPRVWYIWRGNALLTSAKGNEYFLRHYLGTDSNAVADETGSDRTSEVKRDGAAPTGKLDLVVDINFRMDSSALYSDIILPTATWYEKDDLNTTDLHSFIHPLSEAVPPCWESKTDWDIFKTVAAKVSELAPAHFPGPFRDIVAVPLGHDSPQEISQPEVKDWYRGECDPVPGTTMPQFVIVERDYVNLHTRFISYGHRERDEGMAERGIRWDIKDVYDDFTKAAPTITWNGKQYLSLANAREAANVLLHFAPETNGEIAHRGFKVLESAVGLPLADLAEDNRAVRRSFDDLVAQPRRILTSPLWTGITNEGRAYSAFCLNVERLVPWRTLTGRQHFYVDHQGYIDFGENLPAFKSKIGLQDTRDLLKNAPSDKALVLNTITPHGKWHIHTTYSDNLIMLTLSRGVEPFWLNLDDAKQIGVRDNDWVEVYNDNGVIVTRAAVSVRVPRGVGIFYHAPERTISFPKSPERNNRRGGGTNSITRIRLKPSLMVGAYAQLSFAFNAWGPPAGDRDTYTIVRKLEGKPEF